MRYGGHVHTFATGRAGTLRSGVTSDRERRVQEHREDRVPGFTKRHGVSRLVRFETYDRIEDAIGREKRLAKWNRDWKLNLIEPSDPDWPALALDFADAMSA